MISDPLVKELEVRTSGYDRMDEIRSHLKSRPQGTGIMSVSFRPTDVVVTTFPKSGTTLMQHMTYQIAALSGGGPEFDRTGLHFPDLSVVSPWVDYIPQIGVPPCETTPRLFKTHSSIAAFPPAAARRHIVVVRDPAAYPSSWLDFVFDGLVPQAKAHGPDVREATFHACVEMDLLTPTSDLAASVMGPWHQFVQTSVLPLRENVLIVFYENILADFAGSVRTVAGFMNCALDEPAVLDVVARCNRKAMAGDARFACRIENKCFGVKDDLSKAKPERTDGFKRYELKSEHIEQLEEMNMTAFGVRTYKEFREMIVKKQWKLFNR